MEQERQPEPHLAHDIAFTPEQLALESLVDLLISESDKAAFRVMNGIVEQVRKDNGAT
jgi:hypothetical protein